MDHLYRECLLADLQTFDQPHDLAVDIIVDDILLIGHSQQRLQHPGGVVVELRPGQGGYRRGQSLLKTGLNIGDLAVGDAAGVVDR